MLFSSIKGWGDIPAAELRVFLQVIETFQLNISEDQLMSRCTKCNGRFIQKPLTTEEAIEAAKGFQRIPDCLFDKNLEFWQCMDCNQLYWEVWLMTCLCFSYAVQGAGYTDLLVFILNYVQIVEPVSYPFSPNCSRFHLKGLGGHDCPVFASVCNLDKQCEHVHSIKKWQTARLWLIIGRREE